MRILEVPQLEQTYDYDCGAKALESVLAYYGFDIKEEKIMKAVSTRRTDGTHPTKMLAFLNVMGLKSIGREGMSVKTLKKEIDKGHPILVLLQAWAGKKVTRLDKHWDSGHWVIAIGYNHESIIFDDPYVLQRTYLHFKELEKRWHDNTQDLGRIKGYGIIVSGRNHYKSLGKIIPMG